MTDDRQFVRNELRISCADAVELVTAFLDDALEAGDLADFSAHLSLCEGCRVFVDQTRHTVRLTSELGREDVEVLPADFDGLVRRLRERDRGSP